MAYSVKVLPSALAERKAITDYLVQFGKRAVASFLDEYERQLSHGGHLLGGMVF